MNERSSVTRTSGMTRREWWLVTPHGRIASNSGCTEVLVDGARTANLPRGASESVTALECHSPKLHSPTEAAAMISRDEYVQKLKSQIDQWNAEAASWEAKARAAQAGMQAEYAKQLEQFRGKRDAALGE